VRKRTEILIREQILWRISTGFQEIITVGELEMMFANVPEPSFRAEIWCHFISVNDIK
jgi:hypothetical protein